MKPIIYSILLLVLSVNCSAQTPACPEQNQYTNKMLEKVITEDKYEDFRIKWGIQNINLTDIKVLKSPDDSIACNTLKEDGFHYPENPDMPTTITYFKTDNFYFAVVHFSDTILKIQNGHITGDSGPPGSIKVYDIHFNTVGNHLIF